MHRRAVRAKSLRLYPEGIVSGTREQLQKFVSAVRDRRLRVPGLISLWISIVYSERLVYDRMLWRTDGDLLVALLGGEVLALAILVFTLHLLALVLTGDQATRMADWIWRKIHDLLPRGIAITLCVLLIVAVFQTVLEGGLLTDVFLHWRALAFSLFRELVFPSAIVGSLLLAHWFFRYVYPAITKGRNLPQIVGQCIVGMVFVLLGWISYVIIWQLGVWYHLSGPKDVVQWANQIKDGFVYATLAGLFIVPLFRFTTSLDRVKRAVVVGVIKWFGILGFSLVVLLSTLDVLYATELSRVGRTSQLAPWQVQIVVFHIYFRDFFLLIPPLLAVYLWTLRTLVVRHQIGT